MVPPTTLLLLLLYCMIICIRGCSRNNQVKFRSSSPPTPTQPTSSQPTTANPLEFPLDDFDHTDSRDGNNRPNGDFVGLPNENNLENEVKERIARGKNRTITATQPVYVQAYYTSGLLESLGLEGVRSYVEQQIGKANDIFKTSNTLVEIRLHCLEKHDHDESDDDTGHVRMRSFETSKGTVDDLLDGADIAVLFCHKMIDSM